jgi:hypothetical protein
MNSASLLAEAGHSLSDLLGVSVSTWLTADNAGLCNFGFMESIKEAAKRYIPNWLSEV